MKKKLFKSLLAIFVFVFGIVVYADEGFDDSADVKVGNVELGSVVNVEIMWDNMTFDWVYDNWRPASVCTGFNYGIETSDESAGSDYYTDSECSVLADEVIDGEYYYTISEREYVNIRVVDKSLNTNFKPDVSWGPNQKYEGTDMEVQLFDEVCRLVSDEGMYDFVKEYDGSFYTEGCQSAKADTGYAAGQYYALVRTYREYSLGEFIPEEARHVGLNGDGFSGCYFSYVDDVEYCITADSNRGPFYYDLRFKLNANEVPLEAPTFDDTIGTITIFFALA